METLIRSFLKDLETFAYELSHRDHVWKILFPDHKGRWQKLWTIKFDQDFQISHHEYNNGLLQIDKHGKYVIADVFGSSIYKANIEQIWTDLILDAHAWLKVVRKDWRKAAKRVLAEYPLEHRKGIVPHFVVRDALSDLYPLHRELGVRAARKMVKLVEEGTFFRPQNTEIKAFTANRYFEYCRIAYLAAARADDEIDPLLSGRDMYRKYADGRHEGLLDIDPDSETAFADWLDGKPTSKRRPGGHPWEIKRGGNTTHIDLSVYRPYGITSAGFTIELRGECFTRMAETVRMCLAIHAAGLPIAIANPDDVRKRILASDNLGIVPAHKTLHRANQYFPKEQCVYDVIYLQSLSRFKKRVLPFITWEPLPILRPLNKSKQKNP